MNKRAREIIFWIMEKRDYQETCTINDLMDKFKVSERTIRYDLEGITDFLLENKQKPIQLCEHGVIELQKDTDAIRMLLGQNDFYSFKLSKEDAIKTLKKHYLKKPLLPSTFSKANHLEEIKGVYVPFWMYDGEASGSAQFHATQVHTYTSGDYEITETSHYDVRRAGSIAFEKIPVDASSKMPDDYMDSIEPYDYAELRPFSTAYLPGFMADKYDVSVEDSRERADTRCAGSLLSALERTVSGYTTCNETSRDIHLKRGKVHYALLPVWIPNTRWEGKDFLFAMNGQTGKLVGNLPVSTKRVIGLFAAIAAPLIAISVTALLLLAR